MRKGNKDKAREEVSAEQILDAVEHDQAGKTLALKPEDFSHGEKVRLAALSLACQYCLGNICRDAEMYRELTARGKTLKPADVAYVVETAWGFEMFISGKLPQLPAPDSSEPKPEGIQPDAHDDSKEATE